MSISTPFVRRPVGTSLLSLATVLAGLVAVIFLPIAPLPQVDFPVIMVQAQLPGASPETMAATVATPLERALGRIAGVNEMTSQSTAGNARVTLQFDISRDIDGAAREVQAAINAANSSLPTGMPSRPRYRKMNPADSPVMVMALTSPTMGQGELYDAASSILTPKISQVQGIGQVTVGGSALPGIRIALNTDALAKYGISTEQAREAIAGNNPNLPKGALENGENHWQVYTDGQLRKPEDYESLLIAYRNGNAVRLSDVGTAEASVQDTMNAGIANGRPAVILLLFKQPGSNIISTVDRVNEILPQLRAAIPSAIDLDVMMDRTPTIRASLANVTHTLIIAVLLVILVVYAFLGDRRAAFIPSVAVPVSLIGTLAVMYMCGFSLNILSLMALTIATGFVVDDAIVVLENISRHLEKGETPFMAAIRGAGEVGFTVLSMSLSLVAVFVPLLFMGGIIGRLFREFAVTLSAAVLVSLVVSLTLTPMLAAICLRPHQPGQQPGGLRWFERFFTRMQASYERSLHWALLHPRFIMLTLLVTIIANVLLFMSVPKSFFPQQDTGRIMGNIEADQSISFQLMKGKMQEYVDIIKRDPAVRNVVAFTGGGQRNSGRMFITLKSYSERGISADGVAERLRKAVKNVEGARLFLQSAQDVRMGGRAGSGQYQYTLQSAELRELRDWSPRILDGMKTLPGLIDVSTDQQERGAEIYIDYNRDAMSRYGITPRQANAALSNAFSQRLISTIYNPLNQYRVVLEAAPNLTEDADSLARVYVPATSGELVPLTAFSNFATSSSPLAVNHQGQFAATTISFNLAPGASLSTASAAIDELFVRIGVPEDVRGSFQGTAKVFQESLASQPILILAGLATIYIVLGMLYESYIHPITILSTLPSAGAGAILGLMATRIDFTLISFIGVFLLIGIVKKNAILMIDFAIEAERRDTIDPREAIFRACMLRFRPIMMTTAAALLGALPLAAGIGEGAEVYQPLGVTIIGGLIVSQMLTLYTTPVVYLYMDRMSLWWARRRGRKHSTAHGGVA